MMRQAFINWMARHFRWARARGWGEYHRQADTRSEQ